MVSKKQGRRAVVKKKAELSESALSKWFGNKMNRTMLIAGAIAGALYIVGALKPAIDSGPMPFPARSEIGDLENKVNGKLDTVSKSLNEGLEAAKVANQAAQQALTQTTEFRLDRLLQTKASLEDQIRLHPNDQSLRIALEHTKLDIQNLPMVKK